MFARHARAEGDVGGKKRVNKYLRRSSKHRVSDGLAERIIDVNDAKRITNIHSHS